MTSYIDIIDGARPWQGVLDPSVMTDDLVTAGHQLADAAKEGDWPAVMSLLDRQSKWLVINQWRPGGPSWFTALHQAAWHGAPVDVARELIDRGALRALRDAKGRTPFDVATEQGSSARLRQLLSPPRSRARSTHHEALDQRLAELIDGRIAGRLFEGDLRSVLRYPPVEILHELPGQRVWFPLPGKYGFHIALQHGAALEVKSWCGLVEGSGQAHLVTPDGSVLVDHGFV
ncbi:ankyrin repeat domain-containing protein [Mycobacterium sp.]|uniref:ankyrin repeat domain-containing protein n=1 Tax=Mycobacterium sp. TaxID=1785 RepID=UPI0031CE3EF2